MRVTVSSSHVVSAAPCPSGGGLLTLFLCSSMWSLSQETVLHKLLQHESFPWPAALHELPQLGPFHRVQSFRNRLLQHESPTGSQAPPANLLRRGFLSPWVHRSWQEPAPAWAPHGVTASFRHPPAPVWGPFHGLQVDICSTVDLHALQGDNLPHHGLHHELQGKAPCSDISGTTSPPSPAPPSSLTLVSAELFLSESLTSLSTLPFLLPRFFSSLS